MPLVTHHVIDPAGGDPVGVRALVVKLVTAVEGAPVFRRSDGAEVRLDETVQLAAKGEAAPSSWSVELPSAVSLTPDTRVSIRQVFDGDSSSLKRTPFSIAVPSGLGPFRLVDLLEGGPPLPGGDPVDPGVGAIAHTHVQATPSTVWIVDHALGRVPTAWSLQDTDGVVCEGYQVSHSTLTRTLVSMDDATAGTFHLI